jgi:hypothetical protein
MLENTLYLSATQCGQPAARAGLYALNGRRIANVGGKDFGSFGGAYVHVDGATWAFLEENANQIVLQDVVKGKVWKTIDTMVMGRRTYEVAMKSFGGDSVSYPGVTTYVFSRTLTKKHRAPKGVNIISEDAAEFVSKLKNE